MAQYHYPNHPRRILEDNKESPEPGSQLIISIPIDWSRPQTYEDSAIITSEARTSAFGQHDHVRVYGADFADRPKAAGFDVETIIAKIFIPGEVDRTSILENECLFVCHK